MWLRRPPHRINIEFYETILCQVQVRASFRDINLFALVKLFWKASKRCSPAIERLGKELAIRRQWKRPVSRIWLCQTGFRRTPKVFGQLLFLPKKCTQKQFPLLGLFKSLPMCLLVLLESDLDQAGLQIELTCPESHQCYDRIGESLFLAQDPLPNRFFQTPLNSRPLKTALKLNSLRAPRLSRAPFVRVRAPSILYYMAVLRLEHQEEA